MYVYYNIYLSLPNSFNVPIKDNLDSFKFILSLCTGSLGNCLFGKSSITKAIFRC